MSINIARIEDVTPAWVTDVLRSAEYPNLSDVVEVKTVRSQRTAVSDVYHLAIRYSNAEANAPQRLFLKLTLVDQPWIALEIRFYTEIVPAMAGAFTGGAWPFLRCYSAAYSAEQHCAYLLLEDLSETHSTLDTLMPPSRQLCMQMIDACALLHA